MATLPRTSLVLAGGLLAFSLFLVRDPRPENRKFDSVVACGASHGTGPSADPWKGRRENQAHHSVARTSTHRAQVGQVDSLRAEAERLAMSGTVDDFLQLEWLCSAARRDSTVLAADLPWGKPDHGLVVYLRTQLGLFKGITLRLARAALAAHDNATLAEAEPG